MHADEFAFFDAVSAGDTSAVSESLAAGVDPNYADEDGLTPLILAAKHGRLEVMYIVSISWRQIVACFCYSSIASDVPHV